MTVERTTETPDKTPVEYDAKEYAQHKLLPYRTNVEWHTIEKLIGSPSGLRILDVGCGDGIYARKLAERGAAHVLGVDASQDFIDLAKSKNKAYGDTIDYATAFIQDFHGTGDCDLVVGSYIFSYPKNAEEAAAYAKAIASHLKPGGRFVGFNDNPFNLGDGEKYAKYGFRRIVTGTEEGSEVHYFCDGLSDGIVNYHLKPATMEEAFRQAGMILQWEQVQLAPDEKHNDAYWQEFFDGEPPFIAIVGTTSTFGAK